MIKNATDATDWMILAKSLLESPDDAERFNWQFPMGVFGTLREGCGNNVLMHQNGKPFKRRLAFLPHFVARGLTIEFVENASAPFEVFYYEPDQWDKMIPRVDRLESFSPETHTRRKSADADGDYYRWGYYRTLATLRLLPEGFKHELFPEDYPIRVKERNLELDPQTFLNYEPVAAWIYSSMRQNIDASRNPALIASPILWPKS